MDGNWVRDGDAWTKHTWVGDTSVTYVVDREEHGHGWFVAQRHVSGAAMVTTVGVSRDPEGVKHLADLDSDELQEKGF